MRWKRKIAGLLACLLIAGRAAALDYTIEAPENYLFGRASSVEIVHREAEPANQDRSKNVAMIPPGFGTPTSYLPGSGEYLTPNLVPGALSGGSSTASRAQIIRRAIRLTITYCIPRRTAYRTATVRPERTASSIHRRTRSRGLTSRTTADRATERASRM